MAAIYDGGSESGVEPLDHAADCRPQTVPPIPMYATGKFTAKCACDAGLLP